MAHARVAVSAAPDRVRDLLLCERVGSPRAATNTRLVARVSPRRREAVDLLNRRRAEIAGGNVAPDAERLMFDDLARLVCDDYTLNNRKNADSLEFSFTHLREDFAHTRAVDISLVHLTGYANKRRDAGAANAIIYNE